MESGGASVCGCFQVVGMHVMLRPRIVELHLASLLAISMAAVLLPA